MSNLYIFIDESGNFDFSPNGTKYFVLTSMCTLTPHIKRDKFLKLHYDFHLYNDSHKNYKKSKLLPFHATEDSQLIRDLMFNEISQLKDVIFDSIYLQKNKTNPVLYTKTANGKIKKTVSEIYCLSFKSLFSFLIYNLKTSQLGHNIKKVYIIFSSIKLDIDQKTAIKVINEIADVAKEKYNFNVPIEIYNVSAAEDINSQITDYASWSIYKALESNEFRPIQTIIHHIRSQYDIFQNGKTTYYDYK